MPKITRWFIKSGITWFILGLVLVFAAELPFVQVGLLLLPVYWHMIVIGWITQVIMGVSVWMFPKKLEGERRGLVLPEWIMVCLFNTGLILLATSAITSASFATPLTGFALIGASVMIFAGLIW